MPVYSLETEVLESKSSFINFLGTFGIFDEGNSSCPCRFSSPCCAAMHRSIRKDNNGKQVPNWRCYKKTCETTRSIRHSNAFFMYKDVNGKSNSKISIRSIVTLVYLFVNTTHESDNYRYLPRPLYCSGLDIDVWRGALFVNSKRSVSERDR